MPLVRTGLLAIPDAEKQEKAINAFTTIKDRALKNGAPYILSSRAAKCTVASDKPGSSVTWTVVYMLSFGSKEYDFYLILDEQYFAKEDPVIKELREKAGVVEAAGYISVVADI
ncbi:hypothetical protein DL771_008919 [Monosporascus sp. 5C6A]|nr:hypothetical protein DL771_008919 [Monosporascus sp. 5C6A]